MNRTRIAAITGAAAFLVLTVLVVMGVTQSFDDAALRWFAAYRTPAHDSLMLHITMLGHVRRDYVGDGLDYRPDRGCAPRSWWSRAASSYSWV